MITTGDHPLNRIFPSDAVENIEEEPSLLCRIKKHILSCISCTISVSIFVVSLIGIILSSISIISVLIVYVLSGNLIDQELLIYSCIALALSIVIFACVTYKGGMTF